MTRGWVGLFRGIQTEADRPFFAVLQLVSTVTWSLLSRFQANRVGRLTEANQGNLRPHRHPHYVRADAAGAIVVEPLEAQGVAAAIPGCLPRDQTAERVVAVVGDQRAESAGDLAVDVDGRGARVGDVVDLYPLADVCQSLGNSPAVAAQHDLMPQGQSFERAVSGRNDAAVRGPVMIAAAVGATHEAAQHATELGRIDPQPPKGLAT